MSAPVTFPCYVSAEVVPGARIRFTTSHPKDMSDETLQVIAEYPTHGKHIHLPVQSGSSRIPKLMNRKYTREWYPNVFRPLKNHSGLWTDYRYFSGFHSKRITSFLSLMEEMRVRFAFMFKYSERPGTYTFQRSYWWCTRGNQRWPGWMRSLLCKTVCRSKPIKKCRQTYEVLAGLQSVRANSCLAVRNKTRWLCWIEPIRRFCSSRYKPKPVQPRSKAFGCVIPGWIIKRGYLICCVRWDSLVVMSLFPVIFRHYNPQDDVTIPPAKAVKNSKQSIDEPCHGIIHSKIFS